MSSLLWPGNTTALHYIALTGRISNILSQFTCFPYYTYIVNIYVLFFYKIDYKVSISVSIVCTYLSNITYNDEKVFNIRLQTLNREKSRSRYLIFLNFCETQYDV